LSIDGLGIRLIFYGCEGYVYGLWVMGLWLMVDGLWLMVDRLWFVGCSLWVYSLWVMGYSNLLAINNPANPQIL